MPESRAAGVRRGIERALPDRPFAIELWDGTRIAPTGQGPTLFVRSPRAIGHLIRAPGALGLARAYVCGDLDTDDLDGIVALRGRWQPPKLGPLRRLRLTGSALRAYGVRPLPAPPAAELGSSRTRHHFDVSNEFFTLFLDEDMTYSSALWEEGVVTLEDAQRAKLELICRKLELEPGMRVLDIGCGWGSLAIHAAREHGAQVVAITISEPQVELARRRVVEAGLGDVVEVRKLDYRDLRGERFDAVASIGMVHHVGAAQIDAYAERISQVLEPGGRVLNRRHHLDPVRVERCATSATTSRAVTSFRTGSP